MIHNPINCLLFESFACLTGCLNVVLRELGDCGQNDEP